MIQRGFQDSMAVTSLCEEMIFEKFRWNPWQYRPLL
jgi:hypothetical protein